MREYGRIRHTLESQGQPIGNLALLIGTHALALRATLVTNDAREFGRIPGLAIENWA